MEKNLIFLGLKIGIIEYSTDLTLKRSELIKQLIINYGGVVINKDKLILEIPDFIITSSKITYEKLLDFVGYKSIDKILIISKYLENEDVSLLLQFRYREFGGLDQYI